MPLENGWKLSKGNDTTQRYHLNRILVEIRSYMDELLAGISALSTSVIAEGTNLYFTPTRVQSTPLKTVTVATLPAPVDGLMVYVTDEVGGAVPAFCDGTNFRRVTDRAIVS